MQTNEAQTSRRRRSLSKLTVAAFLGVLAAVWLTLAPAQADYAMCLEFCDFTCDSLGGKSCTYWYYTSEGSCYINCG